MKNSFILLTILIIISICSCEDEQDDIEIRNDKDTIESELDLVCDEGLFISFDEEQDAIFDLFSRGDNIIYNTFDEIKILNLNSGQTNVLLSDAFVFQSQAINDEIYFCTTKGLYRLDQNDLCCLEQISNFSCRDMTIDNQSEVYFIGYSNTNPEIQRNEIHKVNENGYTLLGQVESQILQGIYAASNDELWIVTDQADDKVYRMSTGGSLISVFDSSNSPFEQNVYWSEIWIETYDNRTVLISKNGLRVPIIALWDGATSQWEYVITDELLENREIGDDKTRLLVTPSYTDVQILDDNLFISTTLAGCVGIHKFHLDSTFPLSDSDYFIIQDDRLQIGQCIQGIEINGQNISIFSQRALFTGELCQ